MAGPVKHRLAAAAFAAVSAAGVVGIKLQEGEVQTVYLDPVGIPTVCVGSTKGLRLTDVGKRYTAERCDELLRSDLRVAQAGVVRLVKIKITQEQYDALVSFVFNVGEGAFAGSTLLKAINANECWRAAGEFNKWVYAKKVKLPGLVKRRSWESGLWASGCDGVAMSQSSPQVVTSVTGIRASTTYSSGARFVDALWSTGAPTNGPALASFVGAYAFRAPTAPQSSVSTTWHGRVVS